MVKNKVKGLLHGQMDACIRENGLTDNNMAMGRFRTEKAKLRKVSGSLGKE